MTGSGGTATVGGTGSTWTNSQDLFIGGDDTTASGTGVLRVNSDGTVNVAGTIRMWPDGTLHLDGGTLVADTIDHTHGGAFNFAAGRLTVDLFQGDLINQDGTLAPGNSPALATTVPEPGSALALLFGIVLTARLTMRQRPPTIPP